MRCGADYAYLRRLFRDLFYRENYQQDFIYDWTILDYVWTARPAAASLPSLCPLCPLCPPPLPLYLPLSSPVFRLLPCPPPHFRVLQSLPHTRRHTTQMQMQ
jgi:hypothetical protein